jgi:hypothetical protein
MLLFTNIFDELKPFSFCLVSRPDTHAFITDGNYAQTANT